MTKIEYDAAIASTEEVLVDFKADWCMPCKLLTPKLDNVLNKYPTIKLVVINVDEVDSNIMINLGVKSIPTLIFYKNGQKIDTISGNQTEEQLSEFLDNSKKQ